MCSRQKNLFPVCVLFIYALYSLPLSFVLEGFDPASGICGSGMAGGIFRIRDIRTDSMNTTFEID